MTKNRISVGIFGLIFLAGIHCSGDAVLTVDVKNYADLGKFPANQPRQTVFTLTNTGDAPLKIGKISTGCECLSVGLDKHDAEPGEKVSMLVTLLPGTVNGHFQKKIRIRSNANPAINEVIISGNAMPLVEILPDAVVHAGNIPIDTTWTITRQLKTDNDQVKLGKPEVKSDYPATITMEQKNPRNWQLTIGISGKTIGKDLRGTVVIPILEPAGWAPLRIEYGARLGLELRSSLNQLFIPSDPQAAFSRNFSVYLIGSTLNTAKLEFPSLPGTTFKVVKTYSFEAEIEMRRTASAEAPKYDLETLSIGYPGASPAFIKVTQARFLNPRAKSP